MKKILLIGTGGTIASKPTDAGLTPMLDTEEILSYVPEVNGFCEVDAVQILNLDSTNMNPKHWLAIAEAVRVNYDRYDGFVISHGTDTMAYTAAALSYLIQNSPKPVVITGSQKSVFVRDTDARSNLEDAFCYASQDRAHGVCIVFDGRAIVGTRARKMRTKSYNAFSSIDYPELALIRDGRVVHYIELETCKRGPVFYNRLDDRVFPLKLIPGLKADIFSWLKDSYDAVVVESFGVGGIPCYGDEGFIDAIADWIASGKIMVMTTQVPHEGSDMEVYQVGNLVKEKCELMEAYNMTFESVVTKLMWILSQTRDPAAVREMFYTPVQLDMI